MSCAVGVNGTDKARILNSQDETQLMLLPPRLASNTKYRVTVPTDAIFYASYFQFEFTTQAGWSVRLFSATL